MKNKYNINVIFNINARIIYEKYNKYTLIYILKN